MTDLFPEMTAFEAELQERSVRIEALEYAARLNTNWTVDDYINNAYKIESYIRNGVVEDES